MEELKNKIDELEGYIGELETLLGDVHSDILSSDTKYLVGNFRNEITKTINELTLYLAKVKKEYANMVDNKKWSD
jgi:archaellum component FlaC